MSSVSPPWTPVVTKDILNLGYNHNLLLSSDVTDIAI